MTHWQVKLSTCSCIPRDEHDLELVPVNVYPHTAVCLQIHLARQFVPKSFWAQMSEVERVGGLGGVVMCSERI